MAKASRGGKRGASGSLGGGSSVSISGLNPNPLQGAPTVTPTQVIPPTAQQVMQGNVLPQGGVSFDKFQQMTDDEKADVITSALGVGVPMFLEDSALQKFAYYTGMSDKPTTVTDSQLDKMKGTSLYRTVDNAYNRRTDMGYTSTDIYKQIRDGDYTMYSDSGGSAHGKGIYFADSFGGSAVYGNGQKTTLMMRAKITSGNTISESKLRSDYQSALNRRDKLALACSNADGSSARNLYGLAKGYSVVDAGSYKVVLNRGALSMSDKVVMNPQRQGKWN